MVMNILDVQKFDEATLELSLSNEPLSRTIMEALDQVKYMIEQKSLKLIIEDDVTAVSRIDMELITRVVVNILSNAIKFSPANKELIIKTQVKEGFIKCTVKDNGPGIPQDKINLVFDKFTQINAKKSGNVRSTGIGLTFCKLAIEAHGGEIGVSSEEGKGATFWFTLPILSESTHSALKKSNRTEDVVLISEDFILPSLESTLLKPYLEELQQWEVYDYSEVIEIIEKIKIEDSPEISEWKTHLIKALQHVNEEQYTHLIKL